MSALVEQVRRAGTSFYWAIRLLPPMRREAMAAVYLFCRAVDDIADGTAATDRKRAELAAWRTWIEAAAPCPAADLGPALEDARQRFLLPDEAFLAIIDGVAMDLPPGLIAPPFATLERYCAGVAGAVGRVSVRIFGAAPGPQVDAFALTTGEALQFTNILRDILPDATVGRLYLPRELLEDAGIPAGGDVDAMVAHPRLADACAGLAIAAEERYVRAFSQLRALPATDRRALRPAAVMLALYRDLLGRLQRRGWDHASLQVRAPASSRLGRLGTVLRYRLFDA